MTLNVAFGELTRVLPWSLRALGYPFGTADRGAQLIALAAALDPTVLDQIANANQRPEDGVLIFRELNQLKAEANGCALLETGAVVMDYLAAHANEADTVSAKIVDVTVPQLLPAILLTGADYGLTAVALWYGPHGLDWMIATLTDCGPRLHKGNDLATLVEGVGHASLADHIKQSDTTQGLVLIATEQPVTLCFGTPGVDVSKSIVAANSMGIPVSEKTLKALYALEMITWAPTSERSRSQAGFTPKPARNS